MPKHAEPISRSQKLRHRNKSCPFCAEMIRYEAIKCRFCGEFLYGNLRAHPRVDPDTEPEEPDSDAVAEDEDEETEQDCDILWYGRPSVFALTGHVLKMSVLVVLCAAVYLYPVTALVAWLDARLPRVSVSADLLSRIEVWIDLGALGLIAAAALALAWKIIALKSVYYEVSPDRIEWSRGIFERRVDNIDMFRVIDLKLHRSLLECILGIGTVRLTTKDDSDPHFDFFKVRDCRYLYDIIKEAGLEADKKRGVIHLE